MPDTTRAIVVVDDDAGMNQAIERLLSAAGFHAVTFASAEDLLEAGAAASAACLILDVNLPGLSGFELRQQLLQNGIKPPAIFITAYDDPASKARAREAEACGYFTKPFRAQTLLTAVTGAIEHR